MKNLNILQLDWKEDFEDFKDHILYKMGVFDMINKKCDIIIGEFKDVILELDRIPAAIHI